MMARRIFVLLILVLSMVVGSAALASAGELSEVLDRQADAVYSGEQTVVCATPDGSRSDVYEVGQADGVVATRSASGVYRSGLVADAAAWATGGDYQAEITGTSWVLNRVVEVVEIRHEDTVRVLVSIDEETGVVLSSDVFNADGTRYCSTRFTQFTAGEPGLAALVEAPIVDEAISIAPDDDLAARLPDDVAGFVRQSVTPGPEPEIMSAYYVDGLFSFTLLNSPRPIEVPELDDAPSIPGKSGEYRRVFDVGTVVYEWQSQVGGFVLVGDLPLDLQESVLAELPAAESAGLFQRIWRGIFD